MTAFTQILIVAYILITLLTVAILVLTKGFKGRPLRFVKIAGYVLMWLSLTAEVAYHGGQEIGIQVPESIHSAAMPLGAIGAYTLVKSSGFDTDDRNNKHTGGGKYAGA